MPDDCLFKAWRHSREEDAEGVEVYRPTNYNFPLSRGRDGIELRRDGTFVSMGPGPDDRTVPIAGAWRMEEGAANNALVTRAGDGAARKLTIVHCDDDVLKVKWN
jgi:hypothetical protein